MSYASEACKLNEYLVICIPSFSNVVSLTALWTPSAFLGTSEPSRCAGL